MEERRGEKGGREEGREKETEEGRKEFRTSSNGTSSFYQKEFRLWWDPTNVGSVETVKCNLSNYFLTMQCTRFTISWFSSLDQEG